MIKLPEICKNCIFVGNSEKTCKKGIYYKNKKNKCLYRKDK